MPDTVRDARVAIDRLREGTLALLWRQWAAFGRAAARPPRSIVDVEALLLASRWFRDDEARLEDAKASWRADFDAMVSMQRLRNLAARASVVLPDVAHDVPAANASEPGGRRRRAPHPLSVGGACTLMVRLRLLCSVGAKADILTILLGRSADLALPEWMLEHEAAYGPHAIRRVTRDLSWTGVVASSRDGQHGLRAPEELWSLLRVSRSRLPTWPGWFTVFLWVAASHRIVADARARGVTSYGLGGRLDELTEVTGPHLPAFASISTIPAETAPGIRGFVDRCRELEGVVAGG